MVTKSPLSANLDCLAGCLGGDQRLGHRVIEKIDIRTLKFAFSACLNLTERTSYRDQPAYFHEDMPVNTPDAARFAVDYLQFSKIVYFVLIEQNIIAVSNLGTVKK